MKQVQNDNAVRAFGRIRRWVGRILRTLTTLVVVTIVVSFAAFAWDRWFRYDDVSDFVGVWSVEGENYSITITESDIDLADNAVFSYTLDPFSKTITYTLGSLEGSGRYRFSIDRTQLVLVDGGDESWFTTLSDDMAYALQCLWAYFQGAEVPKLATGDDAIILIRESQSAETSGDGTDVLETATDDITDSTSETLEHNEITTDS